MQNKVRPLHVKGPQIVTKLIEFKSVTWLKHHEVLCTGDKQMVRLDLSREASLFNLAIPLLHLKEGENTMSQSVAQPQAALWMLPDGPLNCKPHCTPWDHQLLSGSFDERLQFSTSDQRSQISIKMFQLFFSPSKLLQQLLRSKLKRAQISVLPPSATQHGFVFYGLRFPWCK